MPNELTIEDIRILKSQHVHMKDECLVLQKINKIIREGSNKLQVVSDFDLTLTKQHENGTPILSSFGIFRKCKQLPDSYKDETRLLYEKYRPIEIDPNIPMETKISAMNEWMTISHKMLQGLEFDRKEIDEVVDLHGHSLRDRTKELFSKLWTKNIPILVFSAGLGDIVEALLRHQGVLYDNVNVISNFLQFNGNTLGGFKNSNRILHVFNKNEHAVENEYFKIIKGRSNVVLMGDTLGDALMADGVENTETILRIGFLYEHVEESLPLFKDAFDIVLVDDQTMNVVLDILSSIL
ncbi:7-methylguanosine phosphate-specific 5'-nucleotidase-like [Trichogramma pretiosum]|uniref:7-methylguanosine phosphate-specific 5'-nucleotidase-like n=1 Tax=Trichogramma pretiosum TaxID=7493 RepID=UPI0006C9E20F|nr:7-methylguanosine phosphate-specific 5'-nucleotidase-like [Trichogramma pretiosum]